MLQWSVSFQVAVTENGGVTPYRQGDPMASSWAPQDLASEQAASTKKPLAAAMV